MIGRGGNYPALSVALGERMGVVGALSIEAAANHLNNRDIDGIVLAEGFTPRVVDAFLTVLSEDSRFRSLPITVGSGPLARAYDLANLETVSGEPADIAACALPLIRQHAFEAQLNRTLNDIDANWPEHVALGDPANTVRDGDAADTVADDAVDEAVEQSFPASDPPSTSAPGA